VPIATFVTVLGIAPRDGIMLVSRPPRAAPLP
jgi:hypothetical protein